MVKVFGLFCYMSGAFSGSIHFSSVTNCDYFKQFLDNQSIKIGDSDQKYDCFCKLVTVDPTKVKVY